MGRSILLKASAAAGAQGPNNAPRIDGISISAWPTAAASTHESTSATARVRAAGVISFESRNPTGTRPAFQGDERDTHRRRAGQRSTAYFVHSGQGRRTRHLPKAREEGLVRRHDQERSRRPANTSLRRGDLPEAIHR